MTEVYNFLSIMISVLVGGLFGHLTKSKAFPPNGYKFDWYKFVTNQISHGGVAVFLVALTMSWFFLSFGEFASYLITWLCLALGYATFEVLQKGNWWDCVEDFMFFAVYGAGGVCYSCTWSGDRYFTGSITALMMFWLAGLLHLALGAIWRVYNAYSNNS